MAGDTVLDSFAWKASKDRRKLAADKLELYEGRHVPRVHALIRERMTDPTAAGQVAKWANSSRNLLRQITETVAIAYNRGCVRDLAPRSTATTEAIAASLPPAAAAAFADIVAESGMPEAQTTINAYAWLLGPTFVIPQIEADGTFWLDIVTPDRSTVQLANPRKPRAVLYQRREDGLFVLIDDLGWSYYDSEGEPMRGLPPVVHGLGYAPVAIFRGKHWTGDWWNQHEHRALVDASLDIAMFEAIMGWSRKQSTKQLVVYAPKETVGGKQIIGHPELPLHFDGEPSTAKVEVIDLDASPDTWLGLIDAKIAGVCELYGIPPSAITGVNSNADWGQVGLARTPEVLDAIRDKQIPHMRNGEVQLWPAVCDLIRASTHRHAKALPPGDEVRDMLRIRYLEPTPDVDKRKKRLELFELEEKLGLSSVADLVMEQRPELTREQAEQWIADNLDRYTQRIDSLAARNIPAGQGDAVESVAQAQGRLGGLTKAANAETDNQVTDNG